VNLIISGLLVLWLAASEDPKTGPRPVRETAAAGKPGPDPARAEYEKLIAEDEAALEDVQRIVKEFQAFEGQGAPGSPAALGAKVDQRLEKVQKAYEEFLGRHPKHVEALLAYGSFLNETGDEQAAITQWEKARELEPTNPTPWNNLANIFGHIGPIKKAFQYYEKAIELNPEEPIYIQNLATTVYLFRKDAAETYRIDETQVFNKALELYRRAMKLDPDNLLLATDYAQSFYGIKPARVDEAIAAWRHALTLAKTPAEKEGIYLHLARVELNNGRFQEAEEHLSLIKEPDLQELKARLERNLNEKRSPKKDEEIPVRPAVQELAK
jgi:tetratricopeptide (TPR) repeat protein